MALKLNEKYPKRWESPSNDYPQGAFKNLSAIGELDGSYLEQDWLNDYSGFFGALLINAQMTPNGLVDTAQQSQFYDALVAVAKKAVNLTEYRKLDDNNFEGFMQVKAGSDVGTGVFLVDPDGEVRGQMIYNNYGLQFVQIQEDGAVQTFTFPGYGNGGEILTDGNLVQTSGDSTTDVMSQKAVKDALSSIPIVEVVQTTGDSTTNVMSQKAFTDELEDIRINHGLGDGQEWNNVTENRSFNVTYKNDTDKPIFVIINNEFKNVSDNVKIYVDDVLICDSDQGGGDGLYGFISFIVPPGCNYIASKETYFKLIVWAELR